MDIDRRAPKRKINTTYTGVSVFNDFTSLTHHPTGHTHVLGVFLPSNKAPLSFHNLNFCKNLRPECRKFVTSLRVYFNPYSAQEA